MHRTRNPWMGSSTVCCQRITVYALLAALLPATAFAQDAKIAPEKQTKIEAAIAHFMAANSIPGVSVAVVENNNYEWSAGFGMADLEDGKLTSPSGAKE